MAEASVEWRSREPFRAKAEASGLPEELQYSLAIRFRLSRLLELFR